MWSSIKLEGLRNFNIVAAKAEIQNPYVVPCMDHFPKTLDVSLPIMQPGSVFHLTFPAWLIHIFRLNNPSL